MNFEKLEQLVHDVLARPEKERADYLHHQCGNDVALRSEVESLLRHHHDATAVFDTSVFDWASVATLIEEKSPDADDDLQMRVGPYRMIDKIGSGGMGNVYKAVRVDDEFEQTVAIKRIKRGLDTDEILQRFRQERQVLANLVHPNISRLLDGGSTKDGRPYLVLEFVDGRRIDRYCDEHRQTIRQRVELFRSVCDAVQFAHRNLVVHRDLKPANILVSDGDVKLLDFGIAKLLHADADESTVSVTAESGLRLTLAYASPEQITRQVITTSSDVYSLGIILYELLTGHRPYKLEGLSAQEIERTICEVPPDHPGSLLEQEAESIQEVCRTRSTDPARLRRDLSGDLEKILFKALHKEPERRYTSAEALSDDLRRYLEGLPVDAQRDSATYRIRKFIARYKTGVAVAAGVFILLTAATVVSTTLFFQAQSSRTSAERQIRTAQAINLFLTDMLASVDPRIEGVDVTVREVLDNAAERAETEFTEYPAVEQGVQTAIGRAYLALGLYDDSYPHLERARTLSIELHGEDHPNSAASMNDLGLLLRQMGRYEQAEALHRHAMEIDQLHFGEFSRETARSMNDLAQVLYDQGKYEEGRPYYIRSYEIRSELLDEADTEFLASLSNLARTAMEDGDYPAAESILREVLRLRRELYGADYPATIGAVNNVAFIVMTRGNYNEAEGMFHDTVELYRGLYGETHPDIARALNNLGECIRRQGRYEDAESVHRKALAMRRATLGDDHALVAVSINNLALALTALEEYDQAVLLHEEALAIRRGQLGNRHPHVATSIGNLGFVRYKQGDYELAQSLFRDALNIRLDAYGSSHPLVAVTNTQMARCLCEQGDIAEAESRCRDALTIQEKSLGPKHPTISFTRALLGRILTRSERYDDAESLLQAAYQDLKTRLGPTASQLQSVVKDLVFLYECWGRPEDADRWRTLTGVTPDGP